MTESENLGESLEAAAPSAEVKALAQADHEVQKASDVISEGLEKPKEEQERNWRAFRDKQEQLQKELEKERQKREEYEQILYQKLSSPQEAKEEVDEFAAISDDDWLTKKQSQKLAQKLAEEAVKKALEQERVRMSEENLPTRLTSQFQDFNSVVTEDNVRQLKTLEPEVAHALSQIGDKYAQAVAAYKYIKMLVPKAQEQTEYKERVQKNAQKPGSLSSVGSSSLSQAQNFERGLTPELKKQLLAEMQAASKRS
jgi:hypothetical protein